MLWQSASKYLLRCFTLRYSGLPQARLLAVPSRNPDRGSSHLPTPPLALAPSNNDHRIAADSEVRSWLARFKSLSIPRDMVEMTFSRSSGPGGQNVNKVNTKATLRCPLDAHWIPTWATPALKKSPFYVSSTHSLLITSTVHRSQSQNVNDCLAKLHALILTAASASIKNEPSHDQKNRVARLASADDANRRRAKSKRSLVKQGRKSKSGAAWD